MSITTSVIKENIIEAGKRALKVFQFGLKTADVAAPFGDDSSPLADMIAIHATTSENSESFIIGYLNPHQIAEKGEKRIYSLTPDGDISFSIHLKNDGTCEVGGNVDNAVRFSKMQEAFDELKDDVNTFVQKYNAHQHTATNGASPPTQIAVESIADIVPSRVDSIKLP